jgi:hypothetical protein
MLSSGDGTEDGGLLVGVGETLSSEVGSSSLGDLDDDRRLDIAVGRNQFWALSKLFWDAYRAASRTALATDVEVTFCQGLGGAG